MATYGRGRPLWQCAVAARATKGGLHVGANVFSSLIPFRSHTPFFTFSVVNQILGKTIRAFFNYVCLESADSFSTSIHGITKEKERAEPKREENKERNEHESIYTQIQWMKYGWMPAAI